MIWIIYFQESNNSSSMEIMLPTTILASAQRTKLANTDVNVTCKERLRIKEQLHWSLHCQSRNFIMGSWWKVKSQAWKQDPFVAVSKVCTYKIPRLIQYNIPMYTPSLTRYSSSKILRTKKTVRLSSQR